MNPPPFFPDNNSKSCPVQPEVGAEGVVLTIAPPPDLPSFGVVDTDPARVTSRQTTRSPAFAAGNRTGPARTPKADPTSHLPDSSPSALRNFVMIEPSPVRHRTARPEIRLVRFHESAQRRQSQVIRGNPPNSTPNCSLRARVVTESASICPASSGGRSPVERADHSPVATFSDASVAFGNNGR